MPVTPSQIRDLSMILYETSTFQNCLESFVESLDSTYGCVFLHGKTVCATKNWWSLHPDEANLMSLFICSDQWATIKDIPVYLPIKSPTVRM